MILRSRVLNWDFLCQSQNKASAKHIIHQPPTALSQMAATLAKFSSHARVYCTLIHLAESVAHVAAPGEIVETGALDGGFDLKGGDCQ